MQLLPINGVTSSVAHALVRWHQIFDIDECIFATVALEHFKRLLAKVAQARRSSLIVINFVTLVNVHSDKNVEHWQNLAVVRNESLAKELIGHDKHLKDLEGADYYCGDARVQRGLDRDDELGDNWEDLVTACAVDHVLCPLLGQKPVRLLSLAKSGEEQWQIVVEIEFFDLNLPLNLIINAPVINLNRQITTLVESAELGVRRIGP